MADLTPTHINWQVPSNCEAHHTRRFASTMIPLRRGTLFTFTLYFNRAAQAGESLAFVVEMGATPSESHHTRAVFAVSSALVGGTWSATEVSRDANYMSFSVLSPPAALVGRYKLSLQVTCGNKVRTHHVGQFILLFNPWCPADLVYMANEAERKEYVLNENGIVFVGNADYIEERGWYFGQFEQGVLDLCLVLLDLSLYHRQDPARDMSRRSDPGYVGRVISSMVNSNDNDNGVLEGKWSESFAHHENPSRWSGSTDILRQWAQGNYRPVQYGQCWVFAGVACTVLRCLGIPTRLVTNFNSAHDANHNMTIDKFYDSSGKSLKIGQDSIWDYHVWNESWFVRTDLGTAYSGWQVIDGTPQEKSQGIYQCGPASVLAVKQGDVQMIYDTGFIFGETNADICRWVCYSNGKRVRVYCDTISIGRNISTKAVGSNSRMDITNNYKYPEETCKTIWHAMLYFCPVTEYGEAPLMSRMGALLRCLLATTKVTLSAVLFGSPEERSIYRKAYAAMSGSSAAPRSANTPEAAASELVTNPELFGKFKLVEPPVLGKDIHLILSLANMSTAPKTVTVNLSVSTILYTRRAVREILKEASTVQLGSKEEKEIPLRITYGHYGASLTDDKKLLVTALCDIQEGVNLLVEKAITLETPSISITLPPTLVANQLATAEISYSNPLPEPVDDCALLVTIMGQAVKINVAGLAPGERSKIYFEFTPRCAGAMQLHVDFSCNRFQHVKSFMLMHVAPAPGTQ